MASPPTRTLFLLCLPPPLCTWPTLPLSLLPFRTFRSFFISISLIPPSGPSSSLSLLPCLSPPSLSLSQLMAATSRQTRDPREDKCEAAMARARVLPQKGGGWRGRCAAPLRVVAERDAVRAAQSRGAVTQAPRDTGPPGARDLICSLTAASCRVICLCVPSLLF